MPAPECRELIIKLTRLMENLNFPLPDYEGSELMQKDLETADELLDIIYEHFAVPEDERMHNAFTEVGGC